MRDKRYKKYRIESKRRMTELYGYTIQYQEYKAKLSTLKYLGSPDMSGMPHGSGIGNPTESLGVRKAELEERIKNIEDCCKEADSELWSALLIGVTTPKSNYNWLKARTNIACQKDSYYILRRKYYWLLDKKLGGQ